MFKGPISTSTSAIWHLTFDTRWLEGASPLLSFNNTYRSNYQEEKNPLPKSLPFQLENLSTCIIYLSFYSKLFTYGSVSEASVVCFNLSFCYMYRLWETLWGYKGFINTLLNLVSSMNGVSLHVFFRLRLYIELFHVGYPRNNDGRFTLFNAGCNLSSRHLHLCRTISMIALY